jgi:DNA modification methylase
MSRISPDLESLAFPVDQLDQLAGNPRRGDVAAVVRSYLEFGQRKPIVARHKPDGRGEVTAGNHQLQAALELGWTHVAVSWVDEDDERAMAWALADNRTSDLGVYDEAALTAYLEAVSLVGSQELFDATGYSTKDLVQFLARRKTGRTDPDEVPEPPAEPITRPGDLWLLGEHRVLCGDSTDPDCVAEVMAGERAALMATDPPYLVDYGADNHPQSWANKSWTKDKGWDAYKDPEQSAEFFRAFLQAALDQALTESPVVYQWHASMRYVLVAQAWEACGLIAHQQVIWVKARAVLTRTDFMQQYEPCLYGWIRGKRPDVARRPPPDAKNVWSVNQVGESDGIHPTQKPVELFRRPIEWHTEGTDVIFEPFGGSGTALIAAEMLGRRCHAIEISPAFVDVICRRYQQFSGTVPTRAGEPVDFENRES